VTGPIRSLEEAEAFLDGLINRERQPARAGWRVDLAPVEGLLEGLGRPDRGLSVLHVGGSKGKGSTSLFAESLLRAAGERVGAFTKPHLERWTERFRLDGVEASGAALAAAVERVRPHVERLRRERPENPPSFFDVTTATALVLFCEAGVDRVVLEVGLGGRLDSTNAVASDVCCITTVELEHTDKLGGTLAAIACEKAGIVKSRAPLVTGRLPAEAEAVVAGRARELGAPRTRLGRELDLAVEDLGLAGSRLRLRDGAFALEADLPLLGAHHAENAALAVACVRRLPRGPVDGRLAETGPRALARTRLPGRVELLARRPWLVVDAAHTRASSEALARALVAVPSARTHLVLSLSTGKDVAGCLATLLPLADVVTLTRAEPVRSLEPAAVAEAVQRAAPTLEVRVVPNPHLALRAARESLGGDDLLVATGSVYLAGIARRVLGREAAPVVVSRRARPPAALPPRPGPRGG
jgi:dihydrofolate synthase/folylpolyglutamate synthase